MRISFFALWLLFDRSSAYSVSNRNNGAPLQGMMSSAINRKRNSRKISPPVTTKSRHSFVPSPLQKNEQTGTETRAALSELNAGLYGIDFATIVGVGMSAYYILTQSHIDKKQRISVSENSALFKAFAGVKPPAPLLPPPRPKYAIYNGFHFASKVMQPKLLPPQAPPKPLLMAASAQVLERPTIKVIPERPNKAQTSEKTLELEKYSDLFSNSNPKFTVPVIKSKSIPKNLLTTTETAFNSESASKILFTPKPLKPRAVIDSAVSPVVPSTSLASSSTEAMSKSKPASNQFVSAKSLKTEPAVDEKESPVIPSTSITSTSMFSTLPKPVPATTKTSSYAPFNRSYKTQVSGMTKKPAFNQLVTPISLKPEPAIDEKQSPVIPSTSIASAFMFSTLPKPVPATTKKSSYAPFNRSYKRQVTGMTKNGGSYLDRISIGDKLEIKSQSSTQEIKVSSMFQSQPSSAISAADVITIDHTKKNQSYLPKVETAHASLESTTPPAKIIPPFSTMPVKMKKHTSYAPTRRTYKIVNTGVTQGGYLSALANGEIHIEPTSYKVTPLEEVHMDSTSYEVAHQEGNTVLLPSIVNVQAEIIDSQPQSSETIAHKNIPFIKPSSWAPTKKTWKTTSSGMGSYLDNLTP